MPETTNRTSPSEGTAPADSGVPVWLAALVIALAVAVVVVGVLVTRALAQGGSAVVTSQDIAVTQLEGQLGKSPRDVQMRLELGAAYQRAGRPDDALKAYEAVLSVQPKNAAALYNSAVALLGKGKYAEAESRLRAVLKENPQHLLAAKELAYQMADAKKHREVLRVLDPVLTSHPEFADLQLIAAKSNEALGDSEEATRRFELVLLYAPANSEAQAGLERMDREAR